MKNVKQILVTLALIGLSLSSVVAQSAYIITGSGTSFTATKNSAAVGTANQPIQDVIDYIKDDASGDDCTIQFEDGTNTLDIGTDNITFDGSGSPTWGLITLTGKLSMSSGTVSLENGVSIKSTADITATASATNAVAIKNNSTGTIDIDGGTVSFTGSNSYSCAIYNYSTGTVNISGGEISATVGSAVTTNWSGTINISGGTVSANNAPAVCNNSGGKITVSGTALITSANTTTLYSGTIYLRNQDSTTDWRLKITGGTVENTASNANGHAVSNASPGAVEISGGMILAKEGKAVNNAGTGALSISGGILFAYGTTDTDVVTPSPSSTGNAAIVAWNKAAGKTTYTGGTSEDIYKRPAAASAVWDKQGSNSGISVSYYTEGFIPVAGLTILPVCQIGSTDYYTIEAAIKAVPTGGATPTVIKLLRNITHELTGSYYGIMGKKITFDLNGFNLIFTGETGFTVRGSSSVDYTGTGEFKVILNWTESCDDCGNSALWVADDSNCTLTGVEITDNGTGTNRTVFAIQGIDDSAVVEVNGDVKATGSGNTGSRSYGIRAALFGTADIIVRGNIISDDVGVWIGNNSTVTVDGTITAMKYISTGYPETFLTIDDFTSPTTKDGYFSYIVGTSTVWVKDNATGISPVSLSDTAAITGYCDLLGRKLQSEPTKGLYIILYDNGRAKKVMR